MATPSTSPPRTDQPLRLIVDDIERRHRIHHSPIPWGIRPTDRSQIDASLRQQLFRRSISIYNHAARQHDFDHAHDIDQAAAQLVPYSRKRYGQYAPTPSSCREIAEAAAAWIEEQERQPTSEDFIEWCHQRTRRANLVKRRARSPRNQRILHLRSRHVPYTSIQSAISAEFPHLTVTDRQLRRIANPTAVAEWQAEQRTFAIEQFRDDLLQNNTFEESSPGESSDSECPDPATDQPPDHWIIDTWNHHQANTPLTQHQARQLISITDDTHAHEADGDLVDLVRWIEYAGSPDIRHPWQYFLSCINARQGLGPEFIDQLRQRAGPEATQYVDMNRRHITNPRAYLATCAASRQPIEQPRSFHHRYRTPVEIPAPTEIARPTPLPTSHAPTPIPCPSHLTGPITSFMNIDRVERVNCTASCGHTLYSDRGPIPCPCCMHPVQSARLVRAIQKGRQAPNFAK